MKRYAMQLIFGIPILAFAIAGLAGYLPAKDIDRAFLGGLIGGFMTFFFRKTAPALDEGSPK